MNKNRQLNSVNSVKIDKNESQYENSEDMKEEYSSEENENKITKDNNDNRNKRINIININQNIKICNGNQSLINNLKSKKNKGKIKKGILKEKGRKIKEAGDEENLYEIITKKHHNKLKSSQLRNFINISIDNDESNSSNEVKNNQIEIRTNRNNKKSLNINKINNKFKNYPEIDHNKILNKNEDEKCNKGIIIKKQINLYKNDIPVNKREKIIKNQNENILYKSSEMNNNKNYYKNYYYNRKLSFDEKKNRIDI